MKLSSPEEFELIKKEIETRKSKYKIVISVCCGTGCISNHSKEVFDAFQSKLQSVSCGPEVDLLPTGCHGFCERGPLVVVEKGAGRIFYQRVKLEDVERIVEKTILRDEIVKELIYIDPVTAQEIIFEEEVPFYKYQKRILLCQNGKINPKRIEDYISVNGYAALVKALKMSSEEIIEEIKKSGLRGRGGAGFPTWKKWELCRRETLESRELGLEKKNHSSLNTKHSIKFIICNADEGDPGAFMDRSLLEGNPHSVIEGMIIGAYAVCAGTSYRPEGYVYIRSEYPLAMEHLEIAINQAKEWGFLGENILNSGFSFDIKIHRGAGAFVCGEETGLIQSIEGKVGRPTPRPPYPAEKGLFSQPTVINNVKTWASVPLIINNGSDWFSSIGTETSKGTMIFSLVGKINNTGLVEVPMGISLRRLIFDIGGGIPDNKKFKAVQTGGPSGGCIPESLLDLPVDYEALTEAGSMMGSGGMIVIDETNCIVDLAKYFLSFTQQESCGKCVPCRVGTKQMLNILEKIVKGEASLTDLDKLHSLAETVKLTSLCGLGQTAPNPVLTTLKYFYHEYLQHIKDRKCPAKVCKELITYTIITDKCNGCHLCYKNCPQNAITGEIKKIHNIVQDKCIKCGICVDVCKFNAIEVN